MFSIVVVISMGLVAAMVWPDLPFSRSLVGKLVGAARWLGAKATLGRGLIGISLALLLFAGFWALQGDAPMFMAMALPELAAWLATFEIATLVEAFVSVGAAYVAVRASGMGTAVRSRARRRSRRSAVARTPANDAGPDPALLAA